MSNQICVWVDGEPRPIQDEQFQIIAGRPERIGDDVIIRVIRSFNKIDEIKCRLLESRGMEKDSRYLCSLSDDRAWQLNRVKVLH